MASKKRRRNRPPARAAAPTRDAAPRSEISGPAQARDHRARKEEARRQREAIRRRIAVRRYTRWGVAALIMVGLVVFLTVRSLHHAAENRRQERAQQALLAQASAAARAGGCTKVRKVPAYAGDDQQHVPTLPALTTYPSQPPASGLFGSRDHVIVAPYDYPLPGGQLPTGRQIALVAWHKIQYCNQVSAPVVAAFVHDYAWTAADQAAYKGEAPEAGAAI